MLINIHAAWIAFLLVCVAGAAPGMFFHGEDWLGGYASWRRRMIRLAHVAFFGLGAMNLGFALTVRSLDLQSGLGAVSVLFLVGAVAMPLVCYLSAWKPVFRHVFFIPALSVAAAVALFLWRLPI